MRISDARLRGQTHRTRPCSRAAPGGPALLPARSPRSRRHAGKCESPACVGHMRGTAVLTLRALHMPCTHRPVQTDQETLRLDNTLRPDEVLRWTVGLAQVLMGMRYVSAASGTPDINGHAICISSIRCTRYQWACDMYQQHQVHQASMGMRYVSAASGTPGINGHAIHISSIRYTRHQWECDTYQQHQVHQGLEASGVTEGSQHQVPGLSKSHRQVTGIDCQMLETVPTGRCFTHS